LPAVRCRARRLGKSRSAACFRLARGVLSSHRLARVWPALRREERARDPRGSALPTARSSRDRKWATEMSNKMLPGMASGVRSPRRSPKRAGADAVQVASPEDRSVLSGLALVGRTPLGVPGVASAIEESSARQAAWHASTSTRAAQLWRDRSRDARRNLETAPDPLRGKLVRALVVLGVILAVTVAAEFLRTQPDLGARLAPRPFVLALPAEANSRTR